MKIRLLDEFDKFLLWWSTGLALLVPQRWRTRQQRFKQYLIVRSEADDIVIEHYRDDMDTPAARTSLTPSDPHDHERAREWLAQNPRLGVLPVIVRLPAGGVLVKRLRYPAAVHTDLRNVIAFDLDRQTPFPRDEVYFDYETVGPASPGTQIDIDLLVLPKRELRAIESALDAIGLRPSIIDVADRTFFDHQINLLPHSQLEENGQPAYRARFALLLLLLALITLIPAKQVFETNERIEQSAAQERSARDAVLPLNKLREEHKRLVERFNFLDEVEAEHTATIDLLNEVTALLTDDTWIRRFDLKNGTLTLQGESDKASEIPAILEGSTFFSSPRFSSPVTRNNATGKDRFQLTVMVQARGA